MIKNIPTVEGFGPAWNDSAVRRGVATESQVIPLQDGNGFGRAVQSSVYFEPSWYAICTRPRHEKSVVAQLRQREVETFLPLYETVRRWKNGDHLVQLPLLPGYTFVCISLSHRIDILRVSGVVRFVEFHGTPAAIDSRDIEHLRHALATGIKAEPHPYLTIGRRVRITGGVLAGRSGILVRRKGTLRVVISISSIQRSIQVEVPIEHVAPVNSGRTVEVD